MKDINNIQKSRQIAALYGEQAEELKKGGKGSGRHKIHSTIDVVRDSSKAPHQTVGITSSGKHVTVKGKFIDGKTKEASQPDDNDRAEAQEMWNHHHDRLSGGTVKEELAKTIKKDI